MRSRYQATSEAVLSVVIRDSDTMYKNDGEKVKTAYGYDEKQVMKDWWNSLKKIDKALQLKSEFPSAKMINEVTSEGRRTGLQLLQEPETAEGHRQARHDVHVLSSSSTSSTPSGGGMPSTHLFEGFGLT
ncbi:MAG: hypothetical protein MZU95_17500 [Desulfomicrobium escambiense]|nr:hypothetical protein [Desulfomicrobium escambiense]